MTDAYILESVKDYCQVPQEADIYDGELWKPVSKLVRKELTRPTLAERRPYDTCPWRN